MRGAELKSAVVLYLLAVMGLTACAFSPIKPVNRVAEPVSPDKASELAAEQQRLRLVMASHSNDFGRELIALQELIAAPAFNSLSVDDQYEALMRAARAALYGKQRALASGYIARVITLPGLGFEDQAGAMEQAREIGNWTAAVRCLTSIAHQWPDRLAGLRDSTLAQIVYAADDLPRNDKFLLLQALYAAHWTLKWGIEPSGSWRDLTLLLLERHSLQQAIDVSTRVTDVYVLVAMRADRRFDAVTAAHPEQFDIEAAAGRALKNFQALSDAQPKSLALKARVMEALLREQHYAAMLAASDSVVQEVESTNFPDNLYDDYVEEHGAYFYLRSVALQREGRWDEAVTQLLDAARDGDVNQILNLASLYCALDRPMEALAVIGPLGPSRTSAYGAMQVEAIRLQSAVQSGNHDQVSRSVAYLRAHRADAPRAYLYALIVAKQLVQAAGLLINQIEDKGLRQSVLADIQEYLPTPGSETELAIEAQWRSIVARREVQAAIHKVGRVGSYRLEAP
jgi:hypothetical protein